MNTTTTHTEFLTVPAVPTLEGFRCGGVPTAKKPTAKPPPAKKTVSAGVKLTNRFLEANGVRPSTSPRPTTTFKPTVPFLEANGIRLTPSVKPISTITKTTQFKEANGVMPSRAPVPVAVMNAIRTTGANGQCVQQVFDYCIDGIDQANPVPTQTVRPTLYPISHYANVDIRTVETFIDMIQAGDPDAWKGITASAHAAYDMFHAAIQSGTVVANPNGGYMLASCQHQRSCDIDWQNPISYELIGESTILANMAEIIIGTAGIAVAGKAAHSAFTRTTTTHPAGKPVATASASRVAQDVAVNPRAPAALPTSGRSIGRASHNQALERDIATLPPGARDIRVNQQQVDAAGQRVGINRPDLQYTVDGRRYYVEYEGIGVPRGPSHTARITANDPNAIVIVREVP